MKTALTWDFRPGNVPKPWIGPSGELAAEVITRDQRRCFVMLSWVFSDSVETVPPMEYSAVEMGT